MKRIISSPSLYPGQVYDYDYDLNGNQTAGPDLTDPLSVVERSLVFNADNMPVLVTHPNSGITSFVYDGNAKRAKKVGNGKTTYYYADEFELIDNVETHYVFAGNLRVAQVKNDQTTYFHKDHLGSSTAVTDASGNVSASTMYMPFGGRRGEGAGIGATDYLFTDQELDASTGLYNYDARLYDPNVGRFVSADSVVPDLYKSQALSRYAYVRNNPLIYTDPTGHYDDQDNDGDTEAFGGPDSGCGSDDGQDDDGVGTNNYGEHPSWGYGDLTDPTDPITTAAGVVGIQKNPLKALKNTKKTFDFFRRLAKKLKSLFAPKTTGPLKNASGSLDDAASAARTQTHNTPNLTQHAKERMAGSRGDGQIISSERVQEAANYGKITSTRGSVVTRTISASDSASGRGLKVVQDVRTNNVITVIDQGSKR